MTVLIVDDQIHVVKGILSGVDWETLGVRETYTAYSAYEARQIFAEHQVDILLCDIEMPVENGISLYRWVKQNQFDTACIFLTAYADFSYAQEAIRLQSFDYILQPAKYEEIQNAVLRAINRIRMTRELDKYSAYGQAMSENRNTLLDGMFQDYLSGRRSSFLSENALQLEPPLQKGQKVACALLQTIGWEKGEQEWNSDLLRYALTNILQELLAAYGLIPLVVRREADLYVILYHRENETPETKTIYRQLCELMKICRREIGLSMACYLGAALPESDLSSQVAELQKRKEDNVARADGVFVPEEPQEDEDPFFFESQIKRWEMILSGENAWLVREEIHSWLDQASADGLLNAERLKLFYQSLIQMLSVVAEQKNLRLQEFLHDPEILDRYLTAYGSVEKMEDLVDNVIPFFQKEAPEESEKQIDKVLQYIYNHIESDIRRTDIARELFLNPDYLSRMFKKEMGVSLKEYIISVKMKVAKKLLEQTKLPISTIALRIGYGNFSHFSQTYKRVMGVTPEEGRKNSA